MASVIKAGKIIPSGTVVRHSEFNLEDMSEHAAVYLDSVKQQAADIVAQARQQATRAQVQTQHELRQTALEQAKQTVRAEMEQRLATLLPAMQQALERLERVKGEWVGQWERNLVQLVIAIARRVVRGELTRQPELPQRWIREALELAAGSARITLHLNPGDWESLETRREGFVEQFGRVAPTEIVADPAIEPGGCRVVTQHGHIDQQLETQLARLEAELID